MDFEALKLRTYYFLGRRGRHWQRCRIRRCVLTSAVSGPGEMPHIHEEEEIGCYQPGQKDTVPPSHVDAGSGVIQIFWYANVSSLSSASLS